MGHRLSKIYTRTGDAGTTGLGDGKRVPKNSLRIHSLGEVDETNSVIGLLLAEELPEDVRTLLTGVQHDLFDLGGEVCIPGMTMITSRQVEYLETELDRLNEPLPPLKDFILPGGSRAAALAHHARTVCRRAERALVAVTSFGGVITRRHRLFGGVFLAGLVFLHHAGHVLQGIAGIEVHDPHALGV